MANETKEFYEKFEKDVKKMETLAPAALKGFTAMLSEIMKDGAVSVKEKLFIGLGIAVSKHSIPCIRVHVQKCLEAGATKEEILEAASVAVVMGGGPGYAHIPVVMDALEALEVLQVG